MEQRRAFIVVVAARRALDARDEFGDVLDVRSGNGAARIVDQDVEAAVDGDDLGDEGVDRVVIALVADQLR